MQMKNTTYTGTRERILHAASIDEAKAVFGSLTGYPAQHVNRCKRALERCISRLTPVGVQKRTIPQSTKDWQPGDAPVAPAVIGGVPKRGKKK